MMTLIMMWIDALPNGTPSVQSLRSSRPPSPRLTYNIGIAILAFIHIRFHVEKALILHTRRRAGTQGKARL